MKQISVILAIVVTLGGGFLAFGQLQTNQVNTKEDVDEIKVDVEQNTNKIVEIDKVDLEQSIIQERILKIIDKLEAKL